MRERNATVLSPGGESMTARRERQAEQKMIPQFTREAYAHILAQIRGKKMSVFVGIDKVEREMYILQNPEFYNGMRFLVTVQIKEDEPTAILRIMRQSSLRQVDAWTDNLVDNDQRAFTGDLQMLTFGETPYLRRSFLRIN